MALIKEIDLDGNTGFSGNYIKYREMQPPRIERGTQSNGQISFLVYKDKEASKSGKNPFKMLTFQVDGELFKGITYVDPAETMVWVYNNAKKIIPELADALDDLE